MRRRLLVRFSILVSSAIVSLLEIRFGPFVSALSAEQLAVVQSLSDAAASAKKLEFEMMNRDNSIRERCFLLFAPQTGLAVLERLGSVPFPRGKPSDTI